VLVGLLRLLAVVAEVLVIVLIAAILATGLAPPVDRLARRAWGRRRRQLSRAAAAAVVYLGLLAALGLVGSVLVAPVVRETTDLAARAPQLYSQLQAMVADLQQRYPWLPDLAGLVERLPEEAGRLTAYVGRATGVAFRVFGVVVSAVTVLILSFYMLLEGPAIKAAFLRLFPRRNHRQLEAVLSEIGRKFGGWLRGQLFLGLIVGVAAGLGTAALGLPYAFLLGLAAGVTELVPLVGPVLGAMPAVFVALFGPPWRLLAVIVLFVVIQQAENHFLVPRVTRQTVGLSPVLTLVAIMVGTKLMGILGALLAVPVAAAVQVVVSELVRTYGPDG
jgi:predicted PurR-regulated permease PerM